MYDASESNVSMLCTKVVLEHAPKQCDQLPTSGSCVFEEIYLEVEGKPAIPKWESVVGKSATCSSKTAVRTTSFLSNGQHLYVENDHFYQDRLGTNTWRTQKGDVCRRSSARPPSISLGVPQQQGQQQLKELLMTRRLLSGGLLQPRATELRCGL